ncbi:MAG: hypothetical protein RLZZ337_651 [Bacteroidota bacterium]|jgi:uncharacterized protein (DUF2147 family)
MKTITKRLTLLFSVLSLFMISDALVNSFVADDVKGTYWNADKTAHIRIYRATNGKYYGKIEHLVEPNDANGKPKTDPLNPDAKLRSRARLGMVIMNGFEWNESEQMWDDGTIYDPNNGKTYDGYMKFEGTNKNKLYLRGYVMGMTWLGRTSEWQRIN